MTSEEIKLLSLEDLIEIGEFDCVCGKKHSVGTKKILIESRAIRKLPELLGEISGVKPFVLSGHDTFAAAGDMVCSTLNSAGIDFTKYVFPVSPVAPEERTVGSALMHFDYSCDCIVGIGSGVINDTCKLLARSTGKKYIIVATAPSMDGYASATSSMERDGLKASLDSTFAWGIIGDLDILCQAPLRMLQAGVGDMLAKYISLTEWQIANILLGEYYCPVVASLVENALDKVVQAAPGLILRDPTSVKAVMEGMVIAGMAMKYAGLSRPASGMEHYFSHIWDMRSLAFDEAKADLHGIQCGVGTLFSLKVYDYIRTLKPDRDKALKYVEKFSLESWNRQLQSFIGPGAEAMIRGEQLEGKYDLKKHSERLDVIISKWDIILSIVSRLPKYENVRKLIESIGAPTDVFYLGYSPEDIRTTFTMTKDIRDKYIASRLLWDLGELDSLSGEYIAGIDAKPSR